jgi:UDP-N-acetylglucosamine:LPS N-acetylglucosamine transferase
MMETASVKPARKVLAIASGGGHWIQLLRMRPAFEGFETVYCSVHAEYAQQVPGHRYFNVLDVSRRNPMGFFVIAWQMLWLLLRERPDVLVTTGAAPGLVAIVLSKPFGIRSLWVDSIANCERLSTSGDIARRFADRCVSQWPDVARDSGLEFWGSVL